MRSGCKALLLSVRLLRPSVQATWRRSADTGALPGTGALEASQEEALEAALLRGMAGNNYWIRRSVAEAVGRGVGVSPATVGSLVRLLTDDHRHVRRSAVISLGQLGPAAAGAGGIVEALAALMPSDCDRYNRYYAAIALRRLGTAEASEVLLDALLAARLDPVTIDGNPA